MKTINWIAFILVVIGGLNWGLIGFFNYDVVAAIFGYMSMVSRVIYALVGLGALWMIFMGGKMKKGMQPMA
jgi:uncharacterized membrane protein YuzA (DUF378 family)